MCRPLPHPIQLTTPTLPLDMPSGPVGVKENYRPIRQSLYKYSFFFSFFLSPLLLLLLFLFSLSTSILPFFSTWDEVKKKKIDNCSGTRTTSVYRFNITPERSSTSPRGNSTTISNQQWPLHFPFFFGPWAIGLVRENV